MSNVTLYPATFDEANSNYLSEDSSHPFSNAIGKDTTSETYAQWELVKGGAAITKVIYRFDTAAIPENAQIGNVTIRAKVYSSNSQLFYAGNTAIALLSGTEEKAKTENQAFGTTVTIVELSHAQWTRSELENVGLQVQCARGYLGTSRSYHNRLYGAELFVEYTVNEQQCYLKTGTGWTSCEVYQKENGAWVLQTELSAVLDETVKYRKME